MIEKITFFPYFQYKIINIIIKIKYIIQKK